MNSAHPLSRIRVASRLCRAGAWISLMLGFILILLFYALNNAGTGPDSGPGLGVLIFVELIIAMLTFFFFLVLYAIGALLNYLSAPKSTLEESAIAARMKNMPEEDDVQLEITPLQRER